MTKPLLFALVALVGSMVCVDEASAGCRRNRCCFPNNSCGASSCASTCSSGCGVSTCNSGCTDSSVIVSSNSGVPAQVVADPQVAANTNSNYQSFSYEPGTAQSAAPTMVAPVPVYQTPYYGTYRQSGYSIYDSVLRGDRKVTGRH